MECIEQAPPVPAPAFCVGVTGHRDLDDDARERVRAAVSDLLERIAASVTDAAARAPIYADAPPHLSLLSQLASGADQVAAGAALAKGYRLRAVLPFPLPEFRADFANGARDAFDALLARCEAWWSLPGTRDDADLSYALAGEAAVAQSDLLIAVWDGEPAKGLGGTADVVDYAVCRGIPVLHLPPDGPAAILWSGLEQQPPALFHRGNVPRRPLDPETLRGVVGSLLLLPGSEQELIRAYYAEPERLWRPRIEFPLLLALAGIRRLGLANLRSTPYHAKAQADWAPFRTPSMLRDAAAMHSLDRLERAFAWADGLADHFAQNYRGGVIFNFVAAASAVLLSLVGFIWPAGKTALVIAELVLIAALIVNTEVGTRGEWHRRWLDYRFLAEQLRTMRSLKLFSIATPMICGDGAREERHWTHWYAAAVWRGLGTPPSIADAPALAALAAHAATQDVESQLSYHRANAHRMHALDHRLHRFGGALFYATGLIGLILLAGFTLGIDAIAAQAKYLSVLTAALPTIGGAVFGIRGAGDFAGAAARSARTAAHLERVAARLKGDDPTLADAARALEDAAAAMLGDLGEWRNAYRSRKLAIPA